MIRFWIDYLFFKSMRRNSTGDWGEQWIIYDSKLSKKIFKKRQMCLENDYDFKQHNFIGKRVRFILSYFIDKTSSKNFIYDSFLNWLFVFKSMRRNSTGDWGEQWVIYYSKLSKKVFKKRQMRLENNCASRIPCSTEIWYIWCWTQLQVWQSNDPWRP